MYEKVGKEIMGVAKFATIMGILISIFIGALFIETSDSSQSIWKFIGILIMFLGSLISWLSCLIAYGFGRLVENSDKLVAMQSEAQEEEKTSN